MRLRFAVRIRRYGTKPSPSHLTPADLHPAIPLNPSPMLPLPPRVDLSPSRLHQLHRLACILPPHSEPEFERLRLSLQELMRLVEGVRVFPSNSSDGEKANVYEKEGEFIGGGMGKVVDAAQLLQEKTREETEWKGDLMELPKKKEGQFYVVPMPEGLVGRGRMGRRLKSEQEKE